MNSSLVKRTLSLVGFTACILTFSGFKANAETTSATVLTGTTNANVSNNAAQLQTQTLTPEASAPEVAQAITPGRATRGGSSYIGVGGNIGLSGDTTIGEGAFAVFSKFGLTNNFSARPGALFGDNTVILLPLTLDFPVEPVTETTQQQLNVAPYIGGGAAISTGRDSTVGFLLTGGVDVPLSNEFTANAGVNVGFIDETDVGLQLGVGYNF
ncbi:hypothetical protein [Chlorogloeopsis sp. ULAP02]|uniref:hypothetical protein n=1 Tax=Chlorogloeopsis sp. ULAP02 TaxID=3107926 RepID=UPI0031372FE8